MEIFQKHGTNKMKTNLEKNVLKSICNYAIDKLSDGIGVNSYGCDLHNKLFNEDYFVIGYYNASEWIKSHNLDVFEVIDTVISYEIDNFGETNTKINSEAILNMYAYICGEIILSECSHLSSKWDDYLTFKDIKKIITELKNLCK